MLQYSKFYPKKVIQIDRVELSTEISHEKKLSRIVIQIFFSLIQPYLSYLTL